MDRVHIMPRSRVGALSVILAVTFILLQTFFLILFATARRGGTLAAGFFSNPLLAVSLLLAGFCGIAAGVSSVVALAFKRDWAVVLILTLAFGAFVLIFAVAELTGN